VTAERVRIDRLASGGDGVGRLADGRTVFVPRAAPGDVVALRGVRRHRRFARARIARLEAASADRVEPPCPHYVRDDCGGCQLQHLTADAQRNARRAFVGDALRRIGRIDVENPPLHPAPSDWAYRTKLTLHARGRAIGLHPLDDAERVFDLETCLITSTSLVELWQAVRAHRALLPAGLSRVVLRLDRAGTRHVIFETDRMSGWGTADALARALADAGVPALLWQRAGGRTESAAGEGPQTFPVMAFEQVHPAMGDVVREWAIAQVGDVAGGHAWDLYAGLGATTTALAARGASVESVEFDADAVAHADAAGPAAGVTRHAARVEAAIGRLRAPDVVITNPPRTGMDGVVTAALGASGARRIVYISCDPATLARDLDRLGPGYRVTRLRAFDLFPQTAHVESVVVLDRA
jgi:23S rRNA (uracil1939-C5)-methyltransferase